MTRTRIAPELMLRRFTNASASERLVDGGEITKPERNYQASAHARDQRYFVGRPVLRKRSGQPNSRSGPHRDVQVDLLIGLAPLAPKLPD